jgi:bifunctional non-homologous end joining protein LigD
MNGPAPTPPEPASATCRSAQVTQGAAQPGLTPIAGTAKRGSEPSYRKPKLPPKDGLVAYYRLMAPLLLRDTQRRPLNLLRCTAGYCFYQRNRNHPASGDAFGPPIRFVPIAQKNGRTEDYLYVEDEAGVAACAEADAVEFHGWGTRADQVERPDRLAFDLDPGEGVGFDDVKYGAKRMHALVAELGLQSFALLSGGKGVHVVVPHAPAPSWDWLRSFARTICAALAAAEPERFTIALPKAERKGRIFLDYLRNQRTATAILPYSLRARPGAPVAAPIAWDELDSFATAAAFTIGDAPLLLRRSRSRALRGWGEAQQSLPRLG